MRCQAAHAELEAAHAELEAERGRAAAARTEAEVLERARQQAAAERGQREAAAEERRGRAVGRARRAQLQMAWEALRHGVALVAADERARAAAVADAARGLGAPWVPEVHEASWNETGMSPISSRGGPDMGRAGSSGTSSSWVPEAHSGSRHAEAAGGGAVPL